MRKVVGRKSALSADSLHCKPRFCPLLRSSCKSAQLGSAGLLLSIDSWGLKTAVERHDDGVSKLHAVVTLPSLFFSRRSQTAAGRG